MKTVNGSRGRRRRDGVNKGPDAPAQKPYRKPKLVIYGDIRAITQAVGMMGAQDGGNPPFHKSAL